MMDIQIFRKSFDAGVAACFTIRSSLAVNRKIAATNDLDAPPCWAARADEVIE
jgi:hypothetical protein